MKKKCNVNIPLLLAGILFCLALISVNLTSNLYAKYSTSAAGSDSARVAKFDVRATVDGSQPATIALTAGDSAPTGTYTFTIKNNSEVVIKNSVIVKKVPDHVQVTLNDAAPVTSSGTDITFDAGVLAVGASAVCTLTFSALEGSTTRTTNVSIQVVAEQVD